MMKKLVIGLLAGSSIFVSVPAFAVTENQLIVQCKDTILGPQACVQGALGIVNGAGDKVATARVLSAKLAQAALNAGAAKSNFAAAIKAIATQIASLDPALSQQIASLGQTLEGGNTIQTAALGQQASAN